MTDKKKDNSKVIRRLAGYLWQNRSLLVLALALTMAANLANLYVPAVSGSAVDAIESGFGVNFDGVYHACRILLSLIAVNAVCS